MRAKVNQVEFDKGQLNYGDKRFESSFVKGRRLDLNDLIKRVKDEEKKSKKNNFYIFSAILSVGVIAVILLNF